MFLEDADLLEPPVEFFYKIINNESFIFNANNQPTGS